MTVCAACGAENPGKAKFCMECAASLTVPVAIAEERKTVTTLFCDLVAFTAMSEAADPEDVDAVLRSYHAAARKVIENHGGTVEKFIGDAAVGVFGVPAVHEDDPERAVRAGLRIVEALEGMTRPDGSRLEVRCGVNTGEALVRLDVTPGSGAGFLTGDAVNVAARLQAAAPPSCVAVGALTRELTARVIDYEELPPVVAKGKSERVPAWLARRTVGRTGIRTGGRTTTPFLGRRAELTLIENALAEAERTRRAQLILVVGEAGIGKSRLVLEFARCLEERPGLVTWRQGRCLPYGGGVSFSALSEILKEHAGILDSDDVATVEAKLEEVLPEGEEKPWLRQRLRPLVGLEVASAAREESFAAWRRFLECIAESGPAVFVLEDLHWADEAMLAFVDDVVAQAPPGPLVVLATTRPELFEEHPGVLATGPAMQRLDLAPLPERDSDALIGTLLEGKLAADPRHRLVDLVGGNPLFAEQYVRLVLERSDATASRGGLEDEQAGSLPLPGTVQAVIAARLDALPTALKALLCDAAVFGETFWIRAAAALGDRDDEDVERLIGDLARRQLVRQLTASSLEGETEYLFWHALTRDVAYQQLPRAVRSRKHASAAAWLESRISARPEDLADVLAHHYSTALELAAAAKTDAAEALAEPAVRYLGLAGDRSLPLDCAAAERNYRRALAIAQVYGIDCAVIRFGWGRALSACGRDREATTALREAAAELEARGDLGTAAMATARLGGTLVHLGEPGSHELYGRALAMLDGAEPSQELVFVLERWAGEEWITTGNPQASLPPIDRCIGMAAELGLPPPGQALFMRGAIRCESGDAGGLDDVRRAVDSVQAQGLGDEAGLVLGNYAGLLAAAEGPAAALDAAAKAIEFARRRGFAGRILEVRGLRLEGLWLDGSWDEALEEGAALDAELDQIGSVWLLIGVRMVRIMLLTACGVTLGLTELAEWIKMASRQGALHEMAGYVPQAAAAAAFSVGSLDAAVNHIYSWAKTSRVMSDMCDVMFVPPAVRIAVAGGDVRLAERLLEQVKPVFPSNQHVVVSARAAIAECRGECVAAAAGFADAASRWHDFGVPYEEGHALLGQGRCLVALGRAPQAAAPLTAAREIFARLGARPALAETDDLMRQAGTNAD